VKPPRSVSAAAIAAVLAVGGVVAGGCGSSDDDKADAPPPAAKPEDFPRAQGKTVATLRRELGAGGPVLALSVSELRPGRNRFGFGLFDRARAQIADAPVAIYLAPVGADAPVRGPYLARYESLAVRPQFQSRSVSSDPDSARSLYVADVDIPRAGQWQVLGVARLDGRLVAATSSARPMTVTRESTLPDVGDPAPRIDTPTTASVGGDQSKIDTRVPLGTMHDENFADVVGRKPTILLFATPALCQSRVCGPVVDIAEQVKAAHEGEDIAWIHQEIYRDNVIERGFRDQVLKWRLRTEPWLFAIDRRGNVAARLEGAFSAREVERAVQAATGR
jgi:hypothetical protein